MNPDERSNNMAIASMVCGIISVVFFWAGYGLLAFIIGIVAISLSVQAGKLAPNGQRPGTAVAGLVLGIIGVVLSSVAMACAMFACTSLGLLGWAACSL